MKTVLCLTTILSTIYLSRAPTPEYKGKVIAALVTCLHEHKLNISDVLDVLKSAKLPETEEHKCAAGCFFQRMGYVKDLSMHWEEIMAMNSQKYDTPELVKKADQVVDTCSKVVTDASDICELGASTLKCLMIEGMKINLPVPDVNLKQ